MTECKGFKRLLGDVQEEIERPGAFLRRKGGN